MSETRNLSPERVRWALVKEIFAAADELAPVARRAFVEDRCGEDLELRREVEGLLAAHEEAGDFLGQPALPRLLPEQPLAAPERIGPYLLKHEIGRGGMGIVYLAERDDSFRMEVAIKVMAFPAAGLERRFRAERQILATLDHPHIARLLDGGTTADGRQYFVLEYVDGVPIDEYCDCHRLTLRERLRLFAKVLEAVQFAHQKLVVHRDLKPSNLLVEASGRPKLLDFGIAKLLSESTVPGMSIFQATETGQWLLTPEYASPEQVRGEAVSTASDVYSLGILLYELLTGHRPYELKSRRPDEVVRTICEAEAARPSTVVGRVASWPPKLEGQSARALAPEEIAWRRQVSPSKLRRQLTGDLDTILGKAQHKDPARRYGSAHQLALDLERHQAGLPLLARPDGAGYRLLRWVRRNKRASAVLLLTAIFALFASWQGSEVAHERDLAKRRLETTERLSEFLVGLFEISDPGESRGETITARELLDRSLDKLGTLSEEPESRARFLETIGRVYLHLGLAVRAEPLLQESLDLRRRVLPAFHPDIADSLSHLGKLRLEQGRYAEAIAAHQEALDIYSRVFGGNHLYVATAESNLGNAFFLAGRSAEAERCWLDALRIKRQASGPLDKTIADDLLALGQLALQQGRLDEAELSLREAHEVVVQSTGEEGLEAARILNGLAVVLRQQGNLEGAEKLCRQALEIREERLGPNHPEVATTLNNLAILRVLKGDAAGAEELLRRSLEVRRAQLGEQHPLVAATLINLGSVLGKLEKHQQAITCLREAVDLRRRYQAPPFPDLAQALLGYGTALLNGARPAEAKPPLEECVVIYRSSLGIEDWRTQDAELQLGLAEWRSGDKKAGRAKIEAAASLLLEKRKGQSEAKRAAAAREELAQAGS